MATYTTYKNLEKPDVTELYHINVANKNSDILDSELHKIELSIGNQNELFAAKQDLNNEISRAIAKENKNSEDIADEVSRATRAEDNLYTFVQNHVDLKSNPHAVTKEQVGLGNADNTSDMDKPVSAAQQDAIDEVLTQSNNYTDEKLADAIAENETVVEALNAAIGSKASQSELDTHTGNDVIHVSQTDKNNWNDADIKKHIHDNKNILDGITSDKITEWDLSVGHLSDSVKHVTEEEREKLNNSYEHSVLPHAPLDAEKNIIVGIQKNGVDLPVSDGRKVNIEIPENKDGVDGFFQKLFLMKIILILYIN